MDTVKGCIELAEGASSMLVTTGWAKETDLGWEKHVMSLELTMSFFPFMWETLKVVVPCWIILLPFCIFHKMLLSYQRKASTNFVLLFF